MKAHSVYQYKKWKAYLDGKYTEAQMYTLATTYLQPMINAFGWKRVQNDSDKKLFTEFAKAIEPPEEDSQ